MYSPVAERWPKMGVFNPDRFFTRRTIFSSENFDPPDQNFQDQNSRDSTIIRASLVLVSQARPNQSQRGSLSVPRTGKRSALAGVCLARLPWHIVISGVRRALPAIDIFIFIFPHSPPFRCRSLLDIRKFEPTL